MLLVLGKMEGAKIVKGPYFVSNTEQPEAVKRVTT